MNYDNLHLITVKYHGETGNTSSRISLHSYRFRSRVFIPYAHDAGRTLDQACAHLVRQGFNIIGVCEQANSYAVITDTFQLFK